MLITTDIKTNVVRPKKPARNTCEYIEYIVPVALCFLDETRRFLLWTCPLLQHSTFQILAKSLHAFSRYATSKIGLVSLFCFFLLFFLLSHTYKNCYKTRMPYPIALKFGTQKEGIKAHLGTNFSWNTINRQRIMSDYSRKITPICCHAYRVNRVWEEAENW